MSIYLYLLCALAEVMLISAARNNGYFRAFRRGYYPGKPMEYHRPSSEPANYYSREYNRPDMYYYEPRPVGFYAFPVYPYFRYGEPDESIYDYKMKMKGPMEKMEVRTSEEKEQKVKDTMAVMRQKNKMDELKRQEEQRMKEENERKMIMQKETVHKPNYRTMKVPTLRTREHTPKQNLVKTKPQKASIGGLVFNGKYAGNCGNEGLYYRDDASYVICTNAQAIIQPCAPGTQNENLASFSKGSQYSQFDFCTVNLVARGGYHQMMNPEDRSKTEQYMNQKVKNYFDRHFNNYS